MSEARRQRWFWARIKLSLIFPSSSFFRYSYELTHGPTYLVFKYQLFFLHSPPLGRNYWLYRCKSVCQPQSKKFSNFFQNSFESCQSLAKHLASTAINDIDACLFFCQASLVTFYYSQWIQRFHRNFCRFALYFAHTVIIWMTLLVTTKFPTRVSRSLKHIRTGSRRSPNSTELKQRCPTIVEFSN